MGRLEYEQMAQLPKPTPQGTRLGFKIIRWAIIVTVAVLITLGSIVLVVQQPAG